MKTSVYYLLLLSAAASCNFMNVEEVHDLRLKPPTVPQYLHPEFHPHIFDLTGEETDSIRFGKYLNENHIQQSLGALPDMSMFMMGYIAPGVFSNNPRCKADSEAYVVTLNTTTEKNFAHTMFDSTGKFPDGLLEGSSTILGNYHTCKTVIAEGDTNSSFIGQYCYQTLSINMACFVSDNQILVGNGLGSTPDLMMSLSSGIARGICVPDSCSGDDLSLGATIGFWMAFGECPADKNQIPIIVGTYPINEVTKLDSSDTAMIGSLIFLLIVIVMSTTFDVFLITSKRNKNAKWIQLATAFSVYTNTNKLFTATSSPGSFTCLNGIRFFSFTWVVIGHAYLTITNIPQANPLAVWEIYSTFAYQALLNATVSVDSFFFLSGLLVAYSFLRQLDRMRNEKDDYLVQSFNTVKLVLISYLHRYIRLTPVLIIVIGIVATLVRFIGDGPLQGFMTEGSLCEPCKDSWWTIILYVNNFIHEKSQCMGKFRHP